MGACGMTESDTAALVEERESWRPANRYEGFTSRTTESCHASRTPDRTALPLARAGSGGPDGGSLVGECLHDVLHRPARKVGVAIDREHRGEKDDEQHG